MTHRMFLLTAISVLLASSSLAQEDDDLVRLPGQGEVKAERKAEVGADRLAPGGGLMASFDTDGNSRVSLPELEAGILQAFIAADANADGELTPLEQQDWASNLPTRDESLFNPTRFDPNLDRQVSAEEFTAVIRSMAAGYAEDGSNEVVLASLKRKPRAERRKEDDSSREDRPTPSPLERVSNGSRQRY